MPKGHYELSEERLKLKSERIKAAKAARKAAMTPAELEAKRKERSERSLKYYADHPEAKKHLSEKTKKQIAINGHPSLGTKFSEATKQLQRESKERLHASKRGEEIRLAASKRMKSKLKDPKNHPMYGKKFSEASRKKMSTSHIDYILSNEEVHDKLVNQLKPYIDGRKGKGGYRDDLGPIFFRSTFEANYARILKYNKILFVYEPKKFVLSNKRQYTPDFYLMDTDEYIELKGYMWDEARAKYAQFKKDYPEIKWRLIMWTSKEWKDMVEKYKPLIPEWES